MNVHLLDNTDVDFIPQTFEEAVVLFRRLKRESNDASATPELLQQCCRELNQSEFDKFYIWVISPQGQYKMPETIVYEDEKGGEDEKDEKQEEKVNS